MQNMQNKSFSNDSHILWEKRILQSPSILSPNNYEWKFKNPIPNIFIVRKKGQEIYSDAVAQRCSVKNVFLEISHNLQENTCARVLQLY